MSKNDKSCYICSKRLKGVLVRYNNQKMELCLYILTFDIKEIVWYTISSLMDIQKTHIQNLNSCQIELKTSVMNWYFHQMAQETIASQIS